MADKRPELLAPAGDLERLRMAVLYGADAVYLAGTDFGMRAFAGNFSPEGLAEAPSTPCPGMRKWTASPPTWRCWNPPGWTR